MKVCWACAGKRILTVSAKCSDCCYVAFGDTECDGYVPSGLGIGGGDYLEFDLCLDCMRIGDGRHTFTDEEVIQKLTN